MDEGGKLPAGKRNTGLVKGHALPFVCDLLYQLKDLGIKHGEFSPRVCSRSATLSSRFDPGEDVTYISGLCLKRSRTRH